MKAWTLALALVLTATTAGCGGDDPEPAGAAPTESSSEASSTEAPAGEAQALTGMVGTEDDKNAFEISLVDSSGKDVTELPAGRYTITVDDLSEIHNFHLSGGEVDERTKVPDTGTTTWEVTFTAGDYTAKCDPHPGMKLEFKVT